MAKKQQKQQGGNSAASYGSAVYGAYGTHHAGANGSIAMNAVTNCGSMTGGSRKARKSVALTTIAVPAVLLAATQYNKYRTKKHTKKHFKRNKKRFTRYSR